MELLSFINLILFIAVTGYLVYLIIHVIYTRFMFIKLGKPVDFRKETKARLQKILIEVFGQKKILMDKRSGLMHVVMFYGFIILQFGAIELIIKGLAKGWEMPFGSAHKYFSLFQEITVFLVLLAVIYAYYRRYVEKLRRLKRGFKAGLVIMFLSSLMLSILLALGFEAIWLDYPASVFTPFSSLIALAFSGIGTTAAGVLFYVFWWAHLLILLSFALYVPQSKHAHIIFAPLNVFLKKQYSPGKLSKVDFEDESLETYGVGKIEDFKQNELVDLYACVECGRCTDVCPAAATGKLLSPMHLITKMRDHLTEKGAAMTGRTPFMPEPIFPDSNSNRLAKLAHKPTTKLIDGTETAAASESAPKQAEEYTTKLVGDVITAQELWACTTCMNCVQVCPVDNEHVDKIIDMRRHLVMDEGDVPPELARTFQNLERQGNPWGLNRNDRIKWREGFEEIAPTVHENKDFEYLFWIGSMGSYDNRTIKITKATLQLLHMAGVNFAILGNEEKSSGDTARRAGNEFLFQQCCTENIETFQKYNIKKIITADPHTFNTFKNEYPDFGFEAEVYHHTEILHKLIQEGRLTPTNEVKERVTYQDPCYLGRYNNVYDPPREVLKAIPGVELVEMERHRDNAMCCGAGGGLMWLEEREGKRINVERTEHALEVSPGVIGTACSYCMTMMSDGTKAKEVEEKVQPLDIAEILLKSVQG